MPVNVIESIAPPDWKRPVNLLVLRAGVGAGKTEILSLLGKRGAQLLDIEAMAEHRGLEFGGLGRQAQPLHVIFVARLAGRWSELDVRRPCFSEIQGPYIGSVGLPRRFHNRLINAPGIELNFPRERRIDRIVKEFVEISPKQMISAVKTMDKRLGIRRRRAAVSAIKQGRPHTAVDILLSYYDEAYAEQFAEVGPTKMTVEVGQRALDEVAQEILDRVAAGG